MQYIMLMKNMYKLPLQLLSCFISNHEIIILTSLKKKLEK